MPMVTAAPMCTPMSMTTPMTMFMPMAPFTAMNMVITMIMQAPTPWSLSRHAFSPRMTPRL